METQWLRIVAQFSNKKVLVIGDAILDTYVKGTTDRLCREAPVPVLNVLRQEHRCGGAANTAINLAALGAKTYFLAVTGRDDNGRHLRRVLRGHGVSAAGLVQSPGRTTSAKKRLTVDDNILLRVDEGQAGPIDPAAEAALIGKIQKLYARTDAVILSDYGYGTLTEGVLAVIGQLQAGQPKPLVVDSKNLARFKSLRPLAVKPNYEESLKLLNLLRAAPGKRAEQLMARGEELLDVTGARCVAATLDSEGVVVLQRGGLPRAIPVTPRSNRNSIGAGDTFISAMTLAMACGVDPGQGAEIGSIAASVTMQKEGTSLCTVEELKACFAQAPKQVADFASLVQKIAACKRANKRIVFTNGCFDILNIAHIDLLHKAKAQGDVLVVGVNSDASTRRLKGAGRPINTLADRLAVLSALQCVDYLIAFEEDNAVNLLHALRPDVFVKGGTYTKETVSEQAFVEEIGCRVVMLPLFDDGCPVNVIRKIRTNPFHQSTKTEQMVAL